MKKLLIIALSAFSTLQLYSQGFKLGSLSVGASVSDNRTATQMYYNLPIDGGSAASSDIHFQYRIRNFLAFQAGLGIERFKYTEHGLIFSSSIDPRTGLTGGEVFIDMHFSYLSIPLKLIYMPGVGQFHFLASADVTPSYLLSVKRHAYQKSGNPEPEVDVLNRSPDITSQFKRFNVFPGISAGVAYQPSPKVLISLTTGFKAGMPSGILNNFRAVFVQLGVDWKIN